MSLITSPKKIDDLKVVELKKELESRGLTTSGSKKELVARLTDDLAAHKDSSPSITTEIQQNIIDPVDDTLDLDTPDSDVDASITTVIFNENNESLQSPKTNGLPDETNNITSQEKAPEDDSSVKKPSSNATETGQPDACPGNRPSVRRRQWGMTAKEPSQTKPSVSSDSVESTPISTAESYPTTGIDEPPTVEAGKPVVGRSEGEEEGLHVELEVEAIVDNIDVDEPNPETAALIKDHVSDRSDEIIVIAKREHRTESASKTGITSQSSSKHHSPTRRKGPKETKAIGYLVELPERVEPPRSANHAPSDLVYIRSLVRPFTADQLKQMITEHYGPVIELWLDRIKSASLVRLDSVHTAERCREGLDGSRWPSMNPRMLRCEFTNEALFTWMKEHGNDTSLQPPKHLLSGESEPPSATSCDTHETKRDRKTSLDRKPSDKKDLKSGESRRSDRDRRSRDAAATAATKVKPPSPKEVAETKPTEESAKLLDDLFRKTTAAPCLYWLSHTPDQAKEQAIERARLFAEKRLSYRTSSGAPAERATRSPFANPGLDATKSRDSLDQSKPITTLKETGNSPRNPDRPTVTQRDRNKSPVTTTTTSVSAPVDRDSKKEKQQPTKPETRKRDRSPFTPVRTHPTSSQGDSSSKADRQSSTSVSTAKRNRSRSSSAKKPRKEEPPSRTKRARSSRSASPNARRRNDKLNRSSRQGRPRSRSVERRAISPPGSRPYGRSTNR